MLSASASTLAAISGMLAAADPPARAGAAPAAVEISFVTHAGEGASGRKRISRDGCYQAESGGSTGGAGYARDSQAGCHRPADVAAVFARLGAIAESALVREKAAAPKGGAAGGARADGLLPGDEQTQVVLIRDDGSRWIAANKPAADDILRAVNELPSENQWYATPPAKPIGTGPQLVVLSATSSIRVRTQAVLASDGRWWCYRSAIGAPGGESKLPAKPLQPLAQAAAAERLGRILKGARPPGAPGDEKSDVTDPVIDASIEVAWPGHPRARLRQAPFASTVAVRFGAEMRPLSPACAVEAAPNP